MVMKRNNLTGLRQLKLIILRDEKVNFSRYDIPLMFLTLCWKISKLVGDQG